MGVEEAPAELRAAVQATGAEIEIVPVAPTGRDTQSLRDSLARASGAYVLTLHVPSGIDPALIQELWARREEAEVLVASRLRRGGGSVPLSSRLVNYLYRKVLALPVWDFTSRERLYRRSALDRIVLEAKEDETAHPELLVRLYGEGFRIKEIPYAPRAGRPRDALRLWSHLKAVGRLRRLRASADAADADDRAFDSRRPLRSRWLERRQDTIVSFLEVDVPVLDVGCGSSRLVQTLAKSVGVDRDVRKLRYLRRRGPAVVAGALPRLPFPDERFPQLVCSGVLRPAAMDETLSELKRVLRPGGTLVVGTMDTSSFRYRLLRALRGLVGPDLGASGNDPMSERTLQAAIESSGFALDEIRRVFGAEMIARAVRR